MIFGRMRRSSRNRVTGCRWQAMSVTALLTVLSSARAAEPVLPFPGASPADLERGLPDTAFKPRLDPDRAFMESYSAWIQLDDGTTMFANLPITNLPSPHQCSMAFDLYDRNGREVLAEAQFSAEDLEVTDTAVACGGNRLERLSLGKYRWVARLPRSDGKGDLEVDLFFSASIPSFKRGDGRVHFGEDGYFELLLLVPRGTITGHYKLEGEDHRVRGQAYLDYAAQSIWAHELATFWLSYRFFSDDLYVAATTFTTPPGYGRRTIHHVTVSVASPAPAAALEPALRKGQDTVRPGGGASGDRANAAGEGAAAQSKSSAQVSPSRWVFATDQHQLELTDERRDDWSGYDIPGQVLSLVRGDGVTVQIRLETGAHLLSKTYILAPLNPVVRAVISAFIARPYTYRYRARVEAEVVYPDGSKRSILGTMVAEMIFVNSP